MFPTIWNIIDTIKSILTGDTPNNIDDVISIPFDWLSDNYSKLFAWLLDIFDKFKPFFANAGQAMYKAFDISTPSDIVNTAYIFMGIAAVLLLVKLVFWIFGG